MEVNTQFTEVEGAP